MRLALCILYLFLYDWGIGELQHILIAIKTSLSYPKAIKDNIL